MFAQLPLAAKTSQPHNARMTLIGCAGLLQATISDDAYNVVRTDATDASGNWMLSFVLSGSRNEGEFPVKRRAHRWRCRP